MSFNRTCITNMKTKRIHPPTNLQPPQDAGGVLHLKMFLRHHCPQCSESAVAEEIRLLHHVRQVAAHPERHEIEIWTGFPAEGLMREIVSVLRLFCCELTACHMS